MTDEQQKQQQMHKDFFDRCNEALEHKFYMEAILMEHAAIEARIEILLGLFGLPCNKFLDDELRQKIQISHRLQCAKKLRKSCAAFEKTKLSKKYFDELALWVRKRNGYIHGLYKNELKYSTRMAEAKDFAQQGKEYCRLLYNEVNRLKRLRRIQPELFHEVFTCRASGCCLHPNRQTVSADQASEQP